MLKRISFFKREEFTLTDSSTSAHPIYLSISHLWIHSGIFIGISRMGYSYISWSWGINPCGLGGLNLIFHQWPIWYSISDHRVEVPVIFFWSSKIARDLVQQRCFRRWLSQIEHISWEWRRNLSQRGFCLSVL
jgi:hypothetical protein